MSDVLQEKNREPRRERGTDLPDIVACGENARTGKIDGPDYEVTYRHSAQCFPGYKAGKDGVGIQIIRE